MIFKKRDDTGRINVFGLELTPVYNNRALLALLAGNTVHQASKSISN